MASASLYADVVLVLVALAVDPEGAMFVIAGYIAVIAASRIPRVLR